jgi:hypothetical protein
MKRKSSTVNSDIQVITVTIFLSLLGVVGFRLYLLSRHIYMQVYPYRDSMPIGHHPIHRRFLLSYIPALGLG